MVLYKRKRKTVKKRPVKKLTVYKKKRNAPMVLKKSVNLGVGFPHTLKVGMRYVDTFTLTSSTEIKAKFSCNNIWDPKGSGTAGVTPLYYTRYSALYNKWCVIGSKIKWTVFGDEANTTPILMYNFVNDDVSTGQTMTRTRLEQGTSKSRLVNSAGTGVSYGFNNWGLKKYFPGASPSDPTFRGTIGAGPIEGSFFDLWLSAMAPGVTFTAYVKVDIEYIVLWSELRDIDNY